MGGVGSAIGNAASSVTDLGGRNFKDLVGNVATGNIGGVFGNPLGTSKLARAALGGPIQLAGNDPSGTVGGIITNAAGIRPDQPGNQKVNFDADSINRFMSTSSANGIDVNRLRNLTADAQGRYSDPEAASKFLDWLDSQKSTAAQQAQYIELSKQNPGRSATILTGPGRTVLGG